MSSEGTKTMQGTALTKRQRQVLEIVRSSVRERGVAPTYAEIGHALGVEHRSAMQRHVKALARKGWVEVTGLSRGIRLLREGTPILDAEHLAAMKTDGAHACEKCCEVPRLNDHESLLEEFPARPNFFVRIEEKWLDTGDFANGDIVAVRSKPRPRDGDLVLARIGELPGLGRFVRIDARTAHLREVRTSGKPRPIQIGPRTQEAKILGVVVGAIVGTQRTKR